MSVEIWKRLVNRAADLEPGEEEVNIKVVKVAIVTAANGQRYTYEPARTSRG